MHQGRISNLVVMVIQLLWTASGNRIQGSQCVGSKSWFIYANSKQQGPFLLWITGKSQRNGLQVPCNMTLLEFYTEHKVYWLLICSQKPFQKDSAVESPDLCNLYDLTLSYLLVYAQFIKQLRSLWVIDLSSSLD